MRDVTEQLTQYASYHRDKRNIATHFVGIPMIVVSVATLLNGAHFYAAVAGSIAAAAFYLRLDVRLGLAMCAVLAGSLALAQVLWPHWGFAGVTLFVVGWVFQFIGHYYEGKKPAFVDDIIGLLIGPLFLVGEVTFALGLRPELRAAVEAKVGPTKIRALVSSTE